jgi:hypothetical protein
MSLLSLQAKSWSILSLSPLVIESTSPEQHFFLRLFENRELQLPDSPNGEWSVSVDALLDIANIELSTSDDEQFLFMTDSKSGLTASIKREHEGVVIVVYESTGASVINDTCCAFYAELQPEDAA